MHNLQLLQQPYTKLATNVSHNSGTTKFCQLAAAVISSHAIPGGHTDQKFHAAVLPMAGAWRAGLGEAGVIAPPWDQSAPAFTALQGCLRRIPAGPRRSPPASRFWGGGGGGLPPPSTNKKSRFCGGGGGGGMPPPLPRKLDLDTCLTPEAESWTDLNCRLQLNVWDGSGLNIEVSGPIFQ